MSTPGVFQSFSAVPVALGNEEKTVTLWETGGSELAPTECRAGLIDVCRLSRRQPSGIRVEARSSQPRPRFGFMHTVIDWDVGIMLRSGKWISIKPDHHRKFIEREQSRHEVDEVVVELAEDGLKVGANLPFVSQFSMTTIQGQCDREKETVEDEPLAMVNLSSPSPFCMRGSDEAFVETCQPGSKIKSREGTYKFNDVPLRGISPAFTSSSSCPIHCPALHWQPGARSSAANADEDQPYSRRRRWPACARESCPSGPPSHISPSFSFSLVFCLSLWVPWKALRSACWLLWAENGHEAGSDSTWISWASCASSAS